MNDVTKLVEAHLALWAITDSNDRAAQIAQSYTPDVNVVEPDGVVVGREALNTRIGQLQEHFGGLSFIVNGSIEHHNGYASYLWAQPATAKSDEVRGWDVLHFDGDLIEMRGYVHPGLRQIECARSHGGLGGTRFRW